MSTVSWTPFDGADHYRVSLDGGKTFVDTQLPEIEIEAGRDYRLLVYGMYKTPPGSFTNLTTLGLAEPVLSDKLRSAPLTFKHSLM